MKAPALALLLATVAPGGLAQVNIDVMKQMDNADVAAPLGDAAIAERVRAVLQRETELEALKIDVESREGHVFLEGTVRTDGERMEAGLAAARVAGVRSVTNNLGIEEASASTGR